MTANWAGFKKMNRIALYRIKTLAKAAGFELL